MGLEKPQLCSFSTWVRIGILRHLFGPKPQFEGLSKIYILLMKMPKPSQNTFRPKDLGLRTKAYDDVLIPMHILLMQRPQAPSEICFPTNALVRVRLICSWSGLSIKVVHVLYILALIRAGSLAHIIVIVDFRIIKIPPGSSKPVLVGADQTLTAGWWPLTQASEV